MHSMNEMVFPATTLRPHYHFKYTVKPVLSGHRTKRTPTIERTVAEVPKFIPLFTLNETFIKRTLLLSGRGHLKST